MVNGCAKTGGTIPISDPFYAALTGKPVGIKLCVGYPHELLAVVKAMLVTGIRRDPLALECKRQELLEGASAALGFSTRSRIL